MFELGRVIYTRFVLFVKLLPLYMSIRAYNLLYAIFFFLSFVLLTPALSSFRYNIRIMISFYSVMSFLFLRFLFFLKKKKNRNF